MSAGSAVKVKSEVYNESEVDPHAINNPYWGEHRPPCGTDILLQLHRDEDGGEEQR